MTDNEQIPVMTVRPVGKPYEGDLVATTWEGDRQVRWLACLEVDYRVAPHWREALPGELCRAGAGGKNRVACRRPARVTFDKHQKDERIVPFPYCAEHDGGRVVLGDGRVVEPVPVEEA
jgi:hypothetical protein